MILHLSTSMSGYVKLDYIFICAKTFRSPTCVLYFLLLVVLAVGMHSFPSQCFLLIAISFLFSFLEQNTMRRKKRSLSTVKEPQPEDFASAEEFSESWAAWRRARDENNRSVYFFNSHFFIQWLSISFHFLHSSTLSPLFL